MELLKIAIMVCKLLIVMSLKILYFILFIIFIYYILFIIFLLFANLPLALSPSSFIFFIYIICILSTDYKYCIIFKGIYIIILYRTFLYISTRYIRKYLHMI